MFASFPGIVAREDDKRKLARNQMTVDQSVISYPLPTVVATSTPSLRNQSTMSFSKPVILLGGTDHPRSMVAAVYISSSSYIVSWCLPPPLPYPFRTYSRCQASLLQFLIREFHIHSGQQMVFNPPSRFPSVMFLRLRHVSWFSF